jgi:hypothetical protein
MSAIDTISHHYTDEKYIIKLYSEQCQWKKINERRGGKDTKLWNWFSEICQINCKIEQLRKIMKNLSLYDCQGVIAAKDVTFKDVVIIGEI